MSFPADTQKIIDLLDTGDIYEFSNPESAISCYKNAINEILKLVPENRNYDFATRKRLVDLYSTAHRYIGIVYRRLGRCHESLEHHKISLKYIEITYNKDKIILTWSNMGLSYLCLGNYEKSLEYFYKSLSEAEKATDSIIMSRIYTNLGQVHEAQGEYDKALDYYEKSKDIKERLFDSTDLDIPYINIGNICYRQGNYSRSELFYQKAREIFRKNQDIQGESIIFTNLALIEEKRGNPHKALEYLGNALAIDRELNDSLSIVIDLSTIGKTHTSLNQYSEALKYLHQAKEIAEKGKMQVQLEQIAFLLSNTYEKSGNSAMSLTYLKQYISMRDSLLSSDKSKRLAELEVVYESEKKQWQIESLTSEKKIADLELTRKNQRLRLLFVIIAVIISALSGILVLLIRLKKLNNARKIANEQLSQRNDEILHKNSEILAQRDEIVKQKQEIVKLYGEVTDSIIYAKRIQQAVLPSAELLRTVFPLNFVMYKPRDIVGGDFYYVHQSGDYTVVAVGDSTGHGVPGGFMSMMGMTFLREIVSPETAGNPAAILNLLRERIIASLQQYSPTGSDSKSAYNDIKVKDGMDMGIVSIHSPTGKLLYSGANNSIVLVSADGKTTELKGSKMPVSVYIRMENFENCEAEIVKGTSLYLFTDGFCDQFGGPSGKKYGKSKLISLLGQNAHLPVITQKRELENEFSAWKNEQDQTDDVTVIGIGVG